MFDRSDGTLVRALWHKHKLEAGVLGIRWELTPDEAEREQDLEVRVQVSNVTYTWDGVVGNTGPVSLCYINNCIIPPVCLT